MRGGDPGVRRGRPPTLATGRHCHVHFDRLDLVLAVRPLLHLARSAEEITEARERSRPQPRRNGDRGQPGQRYSLRIDDHEMRLAVTVGVVRLGVDNPALGTAASMQPGGAARWDNPFAGHRLPVDLNHLRRRDRIGLVGSDRASRHGDKEDQADERGGSLSTTVGPSHASITTLGRRNLQPVRRSVAILNKVERLNLVEDLIDRKKEAPR